ncbi:MAG: thioesterase [Methylomonas sp.]|nr:MAG: thioesterase [Methylomonas sp.]
MDVSQLPFNRLIGLELANPDSGFLVCLPDKLQYTNHLGTVHGSALLAVAEAGSGAFLSQHFTNETGVIPVVRKLEAKFRKPASGEVSARCEVASDELVRWSTEFASRGRVSASIPVEVIDGTGAVVLSATVEWFIVRDTPNLP